MLLKSFYGGFFLFICNMIPQPIGKLQVETISQVREIAMQDFSKTDLFKTDSIFQVSVYDTLIQQKLVKIKKHHYKWVDGKKYPNIIAADIVPLGNENKFILDTTVDVDVQRAVPSRCIELNGKLFFWYDKHHYPLTNDAIKLFDKYHCLKRGNTNDVNTYEPGIDESIKGADYYFCRNNLSIFKMIIRNKAIDYFDPPKFDCK